MGLQPCVVSSMPPQAACLQDLGPELLERIIEALPRKDLRSARLAARAFDRASRAADGVVTTFHFGGWFKPKEGPDWSRFPRLRRLLLSGHLQELTGKLVQKHIGTSQLPVREIDFVRCQLKPDVLARVLDLAPAVTSISFYGYVPLLYNDEARARRLALLEAVADKAPGVVHLEAGQLVMSDACAAVISDRMPHLRSLVFGWIDHGPYPPDSDGEDGVALSLPWSWLTALRFDEEGYGLVPRALLEGPPLHPHAYARAQPRTSSGELHSGGSARTGCRARDSHHMARARGRSWQLRTHRATSPPLQMGKTNSVPGPAAVPSRFRVAVYSMRPLPLLAAGAPFCGAAAAAEA